MKEVKKKLLFFIYFLFAVCLPIGMVFFIPSTANAQEVAELAGKTSIPQYVSFVLNTIMLSAGGLSILVIIFGGVYWMISLGRSRVTNEGKEWVKAGILGFLLIISAYLVIMGINPKILSFGKLSFVFIRLPIIDIDPSDDEDSTPKIYFDEIPVGTLTENLISRRMDCYDFDANGDPIDGDPATANDLEPSLKDNDREDCMLKLASAIEIKSRIFDSLSDRIISLMSTCSCGSSGGSCVLGDCQCNYPGATTQAGSACFPTECNSNCDTTPCAGGSCCPAETTRLIEHGPIALAGSNCGELKESQYAGLDEFRTLFSNDSAVVNSIEKEASKQRVIKKEDWKKLRLVDKLKYLKEKIKQIQTSITNDLADLKKAKTQLNSCYFATSSVKFLTDSAEARKSTVNIVINKKFTDSITNKTINASKYCEGFAYNNSDCFYSCQDMCDPISVEGQKCFQSCPKCPESNPNCSETKTCLNKCIDNQSCPGNSKFTSFYKKNNAGTEDPNSCIVSCRTSCSEDCAKKYAGCPASLESCQADCQNDSKNLITNKNRTYLVANDLKTCADTFSDFIQFEKCAELALQGRYCSSQNPGDPDVFKNPIFPRTTMPNGGDYSSLYFYTYPDQQKCPNCTQTMDKDGKITISGVQKYQECWKGPSCSYTPKAPCADDKCTLAGIEDLDLLNCESSCEEFSYTGDSLTFYCASGNPAGDWLESKWELYDNMLCQKNTEVPVGQTVDGAISWADKKKKEFDAFLQKTGDMLQYIKDISEEKDYCKCDSSCGDSTNACAGSCDLVQTEAYDKDGNKIGWNCSCAKTGCEGNPCQKIINLLRGKEEDEDCPEGTEYKGVKDYADKISEAAGPLKTGSAKADKSEVIKRLSYSRDRMDKNSVDIKTTLNKTVSLFSCYQAQLNFYPTIVSDSVVIGNKKRTGYCYGELVSAYLQPNNILLDNWFSCEKQSI